MKLLNLQLCHTEHATIAQASHGMYAIAISKQQIILPSITTRKVKEENDHFCF